MKYHVWIFVVVWYAQSFQWHILMSNDLWGYGCANISFDDPKTLASCFRSVKYSVNVICSLLCSQCSIFITKIRIMTLNVTWNVIYGMLLTVLIKYFTQSLKSLKLWWSRSESKTLFFLNLDQSYKDHGELHEQQWQEVREPKWAQRESSENRCANIKWELKMNTFLHYCFANKAKQGHTTR